jgi:hypothetical protein
MFIGRERELAELANELRATRASLAKEPAIMVREPQGNARRAAQDCSYFLR